MTGEGVMKKRISQALVSAVVFSTALLAPTGSALADLNVPGLACQAPYMDQAYPMRWHEHYLYNPENNQDTWVVCPVAFETSELPNPFIVSVFGVFTQGARGFPVCYMNVVSLRNQHLNGILNNPGQRHIYTVQLTNRTPFGQLWAADGQLDFATVTAGLNNGGDPPLWTITVNCMLPPGHSVGMTSLY
jgi:hypothetical protein